jgi:hypothetical protein
LTVRILFTSALTFGVMALAPATAGATPDEPTPTPTPTTIPTTVPSTVPDEITIDTANPFIPDDVDLSQCVGTLPRPGCGSEERGGWHQNLVAIAMVGGLLIVFGRVAWGVARSQRRNDIDEQTAPPDTPASDTPEPDTAVPDAAAPEAAVPDTTGPDTAVPDAAVPVDGADLTTSP